MRIRCLQHDPEVSSGIEFPKKESKLGTPFFLVRNTRRNSDIPALVMKKTTS